MPLQERIAVYVSGPYTKPDPVENTHKMLKIADTLLEAGYLPYVPHLTLFWHVISPKTYDTWLDYDMDWLKRCDRFLRIPGESKGADIEEGLAYRLRKPIYYGLENFLADKPLVGAERE